MFFDPNLYGVLSFHPILVGLLNPKGWRILGQKPNTHTLQRPADAHLPELGLSVSWTNKCWIINMLPNQGVHIIAVVPKRCENTELESLFEDLAVNYSPARIDAALQAIGMVSAHLIRLGQEGQFALCREMSYKDDEGHGVPVFVVRTTGASDLHQSLLPNSLVDRLHRAWPVFLPFFPNQTRLSRSRITCDLPASAHARMMRLRTGGP